jgi:hypothetical protein
MILITLVMNENRKCDTMEEMVLTSEKSPRCKDPKMPHWYIIHAFSVVFSVKDSHLKSWYANFSSPYPDSSISANYMVDVDIYLHTSALWNWGSIVGIVTRLWAGWSGV